MIKSLKKDPDGTPKGVVCAFIDLTEQKLVQEKELRYQARLKRLASTLIMSKEKQSAQLAAKLHDTVGQTLALLKLRIQMMNSSMPHSKENSAKQKEILDLIDKRRIARENKEWNKSDELRDLINQKGYDIKDTKQGTEIKKR